MFFSIEARQPSWRDTVCCGSSVRRIGFPTGGKKTGEVFFSRVVFSARRLVSGWGRCPAIVLAAFFQNENDKSLRWFMTVQIFVLISYRFKWSRVAHKR